MNLDIIFLRVSFDITNTCLHIGLQMDEQPDSPKVEQLYLLEVDQVATLAKNNSAIAQYLLGSYLATGFGGLEVDVKNARKWYQKAADQNYGPGLFGLGMMHKEGIGGCQKDLAKSEDYFSKAFERCKVSDLENAIIQHCFGMCYYVRSGAFKIESKAVEWLEKSARQDYAAAQFDLAGFYEAGVGVEKNQTRALELYEKAAFQGNADASAAVMRLNAGCCLVM